MKFYLAFVLVCASTPVCAQTSVPPQCAKDEKTIRALLQDVVAIREKSGIAALAKFYSDDAVISGDDGKRYTKSEYISAMSKQDSTNNTKLSADPEEVFVKFIGDVAILNYIDKMHNTDLSTGVEYRGTFRESRIFRCQDGAWKILFRSEIQRPNATRVPVESERSKFDEYVGHYRVVQDGKMLGEITVTRSGDKLFEAWGKQSPEEILPGGHDTFFVRGDNSVEQFIRDKQNRVVGIHYIFWDDHFEAARVK